MIGLEERSGLDVKLRSTSISTSISASISTRLYEIRKCGIWSTMAHHLNHHSKQRISLLLNRKLVYTQVLINCLFTSTVTSIKLSSWRKTDDSPHYHNPLPLQFLVAQPLFPNNLKIECLILVLQHVQVQQA